MKKIILILTILSIFVTCKNQGNVKIYTAKTDAKLKQIAFENKLNNLQVYKLVEKPLMFQINQNYTNFKISKHELSLCISAMVILETANLKSELLQINNLLGTKKLKLRPYFSKKTNEYIKGNKKLISAKFTSFYSVDDCFANFFTIMLNKRYNAVRNATNAYDFLIEIQNCGYASDPAYSFKTIRIVNNLKNQLEKNNLLFNESMK